MKKLFLLLLLSVEIFAQKNNSLPRSTPEAEGISSEAINNFIDAVSNSKHELHSFMIVRHGKVVAESWWNPYRSDLKHTLYSTSKSFTATAIGFAVAEKKLTVDDKVISFFPEDLPAKVSPNLAELKIKDLLSMSVGHEKENSAIIATTDNWVKGFLNTPIAYKPGTKFLYNSPATYMLSAIVQKVTGQKVIDYLKPRLFEPLGISGMDWEVDPKGINTGGWGLRLKTEDMAKFGQLFLQKGIWNGKQILPASWIEEASTMKIMQNPDAPQAKKDSSDWLQGYCYQMWRCRNNGFRADGANGQYVIVLPEKDVVIAVTAETTDMQGEINLIWKYLLPAFQAKKLPANNTLFSSLKAKEASLALAIPSKNVLSESETKVSGKNFGIFSSNRSFETISFDFNNETCIVNLKSDSTTHKLAFGAGKWELGETTKFGPYLVERGRANRVGLPAFKVAGSYTWKNAKTLELTLRYIESPHTETIVCTFDGDYVNIDFQSIFNQKAKRFISKGVLVNNVSNPAKLIIRGDDMGYSHAGNEALIKSFTEGIETSIEVIAPSPWFPEAVKLLAQTPKVDVGLHFAITSEWDNIKWRPLTDAPSLRNKDGYFYPMLFHNPNYPKQAVIDNDWKIEDIEKELKAQIELALKYIPRLSHISGHMGSTGFTEEVKNMARRVAKSYNLKMVDVDSQKDNDIAYVGFDFNNKTTEERIQGFIAMLDKLENGKNYVFVEHPGLDNDELKAISHIGYEDVAQGRQDVTTIFTNEKVKEAILKKGIKLVSYKEVFK
ncbi:CubicO group peptidase (beta-lactamase class C family) [Arcicella aurantiaca]|uniref:CubicO group peptidase (Beta-lactamase class C family) n=1 Tax=Arcicella aurantiaca TaxID=591202 RepID=A0A316EAU2_9BACT|nr:ChbG/HpnK family deacetylase [Arcicella aurantiaca]PWK27542.1 CubicO group peptidase (beta-lactamase class C family) [Arcicella aurantiaca]